VAVATGAVIAAHRHNGDGQHITRPMDTVTSTHEKAVLLAVDNYQGAPRSAAEPLPDAGRLGDLGVLSSGVVPFRKNTIPTAHAEAMPTVTSDQIPGLLTAAGTIKNNGSIDEAGYRAHPVSDPLGTVVGSAPARRCCSPAGTSRTAPADETAPHPLTDPLGTLTARDTTALLPPSGGPRSPTSRSRTATSG
jgi:DNA (cytosine-5)-methyltransferase 1